MAVAAVGVSRAIRGITRRRCGRRVVAMKAGRVATTAGRAPSAAATVAVTADKAAALGPAAAVDCIRDRVRLAARSASVR